MTQKIRFLGIWLKKKKKTPIQKDTCTSVFIAALFTVAKVWEQCECPSTDDEEDVVCIQWNTTQP